MHSKYLPIPNIAAIKPLKRDNVTPSLLANATIDELQDILTRVKELKLTTGEREQLGLGLSVFSQLRTLRQLVRAAFPRSVDFAAYWEELTRCSKSANRGSERRLSKTGSISMKTIEGYRSSKAFSRFCIAPSFSPMRA